MWWIFFRNRCDEYGCWIFMCCRSRGFTTDAKRNENKQKKCCPVRTSSWMDIFFVANSLLQQKTTTTKHCQISENSDMELLDAAGKRPIQIRFIFNGQRHFTNIERSKTTNKRLKQLCLLFQVFLFSEPKQTECRTWKIPLYSAPFSYFHHVCCILFLSRIYLLCYVLLRVFVFFFCILPLSVSAPGYNPFFTFVVSLVISFVNRNASNQPKWSRNCFLWS